MNSEFFGGVMGFFIQMYSFALLLAFFVFGLAVWDVSSTINRTIPTAMQHGGVDAAVQSVVTTELQARHITVKSVTGSAPKSPWGSQINMKILATYHIFGMDQPVGQKVTATSTYNQRN